MTPDVLGLPQSFPSILTDYICPWFWVWHQPLGWLWLDREMKLPNWCSAWRILNKGEKNWIAFYIPYSTLEEFLDLFTFSWNFVAYFSTLPVYLGSTLVAFLVKHYYLLKNKNSISCDSSSHCCKHFFQLSPMILLLK